MKVLKLTYTAQNYSDRYVDNGMQPSLANHLEYSVTIQQLFNSATSSPACNTYFTTFLTSVHSILSFHMLLMIREIWQYIAVIIFPFRYIGLWFFPEHPNKIRTRTLLTD